MKLVFKMTNQILHQLPPYDELSSLLKTFSSVTLDTVSELSDVEAFPPFSEDFEHADLPLDSMLAEELEIIPLTPADRSLPVIACDMSTVKIADTTRGSLWAVRGSIVMREAGIVKAAVVGPFAYTVSNQTIERILDVLFICLNLEREPSFLHMSTAPKIISNLFEKVLQAYAATRLKGGILLIDGALTAGPSDSPTAAVEKIVESAKTHGIGVAAFSKSTTLTYFGRRITCLRSRCRPPYVIRLPLSSNRPWGVVNGSVYVSHLSSTPTPFRVDVASTTSDEEVFTHILSSEPMVHGYPESLILAHQLAKLRWIDVVGIRAGLESHAKLRFASDIDVRSMLFAPIEG
ncbi:MAG: DNA double-strand break repair nuclease NurA [Candidatus Caldarchaeum sp.]|uniref:DNA double-strand break repair nuclease NurA n=1 Tax=Caldiarchaeum subterraneum TaxID=311458 RepID=A0A7C5LAB1_CALS0